MKKPGKPENRRLYVSMNKNKTLKEYLLQFFTEQETCDIIELSSPEQLSCWVHDYVSDCFPQARQANDLNDVCEKIETNSQE